MRKLIAILITTLISLPATAEEVVFTSQVTRVYPFGNGTFVITLQESSPSCTRTDNYYHVKVGENGVTQEGLQLMFSAALAGLASGKNVSIFFDSSSSNCYINRLSINR
ncbi:response regulator receiver protein [Microbulbifer discodermiae]|uniref:response regulator receiver protein n=1 Tax=Microbulbifer sp. 2201CG32-9 TaxID=3232309 RepID=UPI00345BE0DF